MIGKIVGYFLNLFKKSLIFLLISSFFIFNFLFSFLNFKIDLSQGRAYSLSDSTKKILKTLKKNLEISFYVSSSDLPTRLIPLKNETIDFLNEYKNFSKKITIKILDPKKDKKIEEEAINLGLPVFQYSQFERDSYQVKKVYFSLVLKYGDKIEIINQINNLDLIEYEISSLIYKLTRDKLEKVGIIGIKEIFPLNQPDNDKISNFKKLLRQQYEVDFLEIDKDSSLKEIGKDYKVVLIFDDNQKKYQEEEINKIDNYLKEGKAIFFVDGVWVDSKSLLVSKADHNLNNLLKKIGVRLEENLILSFNSELVNFGGSNYQVIVNYPFWIRTDNFNRKYNNLFQNVSFLTFPWTSSIKFIENNLYEKNILISSLNKSWEKKYSTESAFFAIPENIEKPKETDLKTFPLIVGLKKKNDLNIVVIPSSRFVYDQFVSQSNNLDFVFNIIDNMASSGVLSGIRARSVNFYNLPSFSSSEKEIIKYLSIFLLPTLFSLFGFFKILKRSKK